MSAVGALALAVGPLLGGVLSADVGWHAIFTVNVPVGVVTLGLAAWAVPGTTTAAARSLDRAGIALSVTALVAMTWALIEGPETGWTTIGVLGAVAVAVVAAAGFVVVERRSSDPMLDLSVFADASISGAVGALMLWAFGLFGIYFFTSVYLQDVLGFGAIEAGLAFVPMALLMAAGAAVSDRLARMIGAHRSVGGGMVVMAAGVAVTGLVGGHGSYGELMPGFMMIGLGGGLTIPLTTTVVAGMPPERAGVASAVFNVSRELAGLLGITVIGAVLAARRASLLHAGRAPEAAWLAGYRLGIVVAAAVVLAGGVLAWVSLRRVPASPGATGVHDPLTVTAGAVPPTTAPSGRHDRR